jgi:hypothetical protein
MNQHKERRFHRIVYAVETIPIDEREERKPRWTRVGVSFERKDGYEAIELAPGVSISGRVMLAPPREDAEQSEVEAPLDEQY